MILNRRRALGLLTLGAAPGMAVAAQRSTKARFEHGVASGDPLADRIVLWTRVTPDEPGVAPVDYAVAETADFRSPVAEGRVLAGPERDHTVKIDVTGLKPGRAYFYRFKVGETASPVGRTQTLPAGRLDQLVLAFVTCQLYPAGHFNAYDHIARLDRVDAIIHLGDYIYEYGAAPDDYGMSIGTKLGRIPEPPHEILSLADYRLRHAQYKRDKDLQAAHARAPWICVWDDHEVSDNSWNGGAENHQPKTEGSWLNREAAALQAYYEWMPIREPAPGRAYEAINRSFDFGDLASLMMLESRLIARSQQLIYGHPGDIPMAFYSSNDPAARQRVTDPALAAQALQAAAASQPLPAGTVIGPDPVKLRAILDDPERQMLGARQEQWLGERLAASVASGRPWQLLGNQVVMARTKGPDIKAQLGPARAASFLATLAPEVRTQVEALANLYSYDVPYSLDGWDAYSAARERVYQAIHGAGGSALVFSGDSHAFWANELHDKDGALAAIEFGASSITSPSGGDSLPGFDLGKLFADQNPEVLFCDQNAKGYVLLTLTREAANAEFMAVETKPPPYAAKRLARFRVRPRGATGPGRLEIL